MQQTKLDGTDSAAAWTVRDTGAGWEWRRMGRDAVSRAGRMQAAASAWLDRAVIALAAAVRWAWHVLLSTLDVVMRLAVIAAAARIMDWW